MSTSTIMVPLVSGCRREPRDEGQVVTQCRARHPSRAEPDRRRRVVGRHDLAAFDVVRSTPQLPDLCARSEEPLGRRPAERADHPRVDKDDLRCQKAATVGDLDLRRCTVARRPALQHVRDCNAGARQADLVEQLVEQCAGPADERQAGLVFRGARCLSDK